MTSTAQTERTRPVSAGTAWAKSSHLQTHLLLQEEAIPVTVGYVDVLVWLDQTGIEGFHDRSQQSTARALQEETEIKKTHAQISAALLAFTEVRQRGNLPYLDPQ